MDENRPTHVEDAMKRAGFVTASPGFAPALDMLQRVGPVDTTVLLLGESGAGKEIAAQLVHEMHAERSKGPWVAVNCGALSAGLVESELFGHMRGAFTGADRDHAGCFERADGGTLFLDEIGTMSLEQQVRLLRVLQERQVTRVGGRNAIPVNVRVIAASNEDLRARVEAGTFRRDLFYRLSVFPVQLPPLRERPEDIDVLAHHFLEQVSARLGVPCPDIDVSARHALLRHSWPGNARELQNAMEYAALMAADGGVVTALTLPGEIACAGGTGLVPPALPPALPLPGSLPRSLPEDGLDLRQAVTHLERSLILESLRRSNGNKARAAELLHLKRTTLVEKMKRFEADGTPVVA